MEQCLVRRWDNFTFLILSMYVLADSHNVNYKIISSKDGFEYVHVGKTNQNNFNNNKNILVRIVAITTLQSYMSL
jgi:hypothetical protein